MNADISYIHSLSMLSLLKKRDDELSNFHYNKDLLAIGNPNYWPQDSKKENTSDASSAEISRGKKWNTLKTSEQELEKISLQFKEEKVSIYEKDQASLTKVRDINHNREMERYKYILFSAHGDLNIEMPEQSAIVLNQVDSPPGVDGYLRAAELSSYNLKSKLVYLSACEIGPGKNIAGEGIIGLPFALYVAGNQNTIMTLWAIDDEGATEFSISFFAKINQGISQVTALNQTKRKFIVNTNEKYRSPKYWVPFILYGI